MRKIRRMGEPEDVVSNDPLHGVANLFDLGVIFALGLLLVSIPYLGMPPLPEKDDGASVDNPGTPYTEMMRQQSIKIKRYRATRQTLNGEGIRLGMAYRLKTGEIVYVPEGNVSEPKDEP